MYDPDVSRFSIHNEAETTMKSFWLGATASLVLGGQAMAHEAAPLATHATATGTVLADTSGMTVYVFDKDQPGKSVCNGPCAANWPPVKAAADAMAKGEFSTITRDDGTRQWAYKGRPLYTWVKDQKPGDTTGDGFLNGAWHAVRP